uniref:Uncharacterized protein n=1 Tax=Amphimedon queenslandica TaxID=400682 RepID=A0A1X7V5Y3_AMPQE
MLPQFQLQVLIVPFDNTPYCYWWDISYVYNSLTHQFWLLGDYPRIVPFSKNNMM